MNELEAKVAAPQASARDLFHWYKRSRLGSQDNTVLLVQVARVTREVLFLRTFAGDTQVFFAITVECAVHLQCDSAWHSLLAFDESLNNKNSMKDSVN